MRAPSRPHRSPGLRDQTRGWFKSRYGEKEGLVKQGDYQVLSVLRLAQHEGRMMTATDVANRLDAATATMVNGVDRLQRLGYAEGAPHPTDRRAASLAITPEGMACARRMVLRRIEERERRLAVLNDGERAALTSALRKLAAAWA